MIKGILFDLGGVLVDNPATLMKSYLANALGISDEVLSSITNPVMPDFQKGLIKEPEFWKRITKNIKIKHPITTSLWTEAIKRSYSPKKEIFALATRLKNYGFKIGILSNTEIPVVNFLSRLDYSMFDILLYSCLEGMRKPEKKIYALTVNRMGLKADEIIFIDDSEENIVAALEFGMHGILFSSSTQVREDIENLTGIILTNDNY